MNGSTATERFLCPEIFLKPIRMQFDRRQGSSDGGAVLLKAAERRYGLISSMVDCLFDRRQAAKVDHPLKTFSRNACFLLPKVIPIPTSRLNWLPIPFTKCCWTAIQTGPPRLLDRVAARTAEWPPLGSVGMRDALQRFTGWFLRAIAGGGGHRREGVAAFV